MQQDEDHLVEIYSAGSEWEAERLCQALMEAGVAAQVTGEHLAGAFAGLPMGKRKDPRIWVRQSQAVAARALLRDLLDRSQGPRTDEEQIAAEAEAAGKASGEEDSQKEEPQPVVFLANRLNELLGFAGLCIIVLAAWGAWKNGRLLDHYSGRAMARVADPGEELNARRLTPEWELRHALFSTAYSYTVEDRSFDFTREYGRQFPRELAIRYDPQDPGKFYLGHIMPPLLCLLLGSILGGFLLLCFWQFRGGPPN